MRSLPLPMRRALLASSLCGLVVLSAAPTPARALTSPVVHALDVRIEQAEHRIEHWNRALAHWQIDVARAAAELQRVQGSPEREPTMLLDYFSPRMANRVLRVPLTWTQHVERAHARLQAVLRDHAAREAQQQQQAWVAYLGQLRAARAEAVQAARHSGLQGVVPGTPIGYEAWAKGLLAALGAPNCENNLLLVVTWETAESTQAAYNPLATTHVMPGASLFNGVGVKNYVSADQGLEASRDTLVGGAESYGYATIVDALRSCAPAETTASAIRDSAWCRGCAAGVYVLGLLPIVRDAWEEHAGRLISTPAV